MESQERIVRDGETELEVLPVFLPPSGMNSEEIQHETSTWNEDLERRVKRKFDFHILPWIFSLWLLAFIDRSNLGK